MDPSAGSGLPSLRTAPRERVTHHGDYLGNVKRQRRAEDLIVRDFIRLREAWKLRRENERLATELRKAHLVIEVQKKVALLWERQVGPEEKS